MSNFYCVVIKGALVGRADDEVITSLATIFKMTDEQVRPGFMSRNFIVKKSVGLATAEKYQAFFQQHGCMCVIEPEAKVPSSPALSVAPPTSPTLVEVKPLQPKTSAVLPALAISTSSQSAPGVAMKAQLAASNVFQVPNKSRSFNGRFDMRQPLNKGAKKRYMLYGKGAITFSSEGVHIVGKRHRTLWFGVATDIVVDYGDILDANVDGKTLRFNVDGMCKGRQDICYIADRAEEAAEMLGLLPTRQAEEVKSIGQLMKLASLVTASLVVSIIVGYQMMSMITHLPAGSPLLVFAENVGSTCLGIGILASLYLIPKANRNIHSFLKAYVMIGVLAALPQCSSWIHKFHGPIKTLQSESTLLAVDVPSDWAVTDINKDKVDLMAMDWSATSFVTLTVGDTVARLVVQDDVTAYQLKMNEQLSTALGNQVGQFNCGPLCEGNIYTTISNGKPMRFLSAVKYSEGKWLMIQGGNIASISETESSKVEAAIASARVSPRRVE